MSNTHKILVAARALIAEPGSWVKGTMAVTTKGQNTMPTSRSATCFCSLGALSRATHDLGLTGDDRGLATRALQAAASDLFGNWMIAQVNDRQSMRHADILRLFDTAIAYSK